MVCHGVPYSLILHRHRFEVPDGVHIPSDADLSGTQLRGKPPPFGKSSPERELLFSVQLSVIIGLSRRKIQGQTETLDVPDLHPSIILVISTRSFVIVSNVKTCTLPSSFEKL
jgi:hypothetical protein